MTDQTNSPPRIAAFRPDDGRAAAAGELLTRLGADPVIDPMVRLAPTGALPSATGDFVVLTSPAAAEILAEAEWRSEDVTVCAIGSRTAAALRETGITVDIVPAEYTSSGLVETLSGLVDGQHVEVARSDHGSPVLLEGLREAGATVTETILYELRRPEGAGESAMLLAEGDLDAVLFTSALTVEHFLKSADEREIGADVREQLATVVVGAIGAPTRRAAEKRDIAVDVVPETVSFERLAEAVIEQLINNER